MRHNMGEEHPECPQRLRAIAERLNMSGLLDFMVQYEAPRASVEQLVRVHTPAHVERMLHTDTSLGPVRLDPDTSMTPETPEAALRAAGAGIQAVELTLSGKAGLGFCAVRPPGHHAERAQAMGFCFFNNVAVAAAHALAQGLERVAIVDFDLHYGNGTADIFADDPRVWLYSTYQHPLYPYWKGKPGAPHLVDVPLPPGAGSAEFRAAVQQRWKPTLLEQRPQMILVSAGFDAYVEDPMGDLRLGYDDYSWVAAQIQDVAETCCPGRIVATLEGGYAPHALARCVERFLQPFLSGNTPL
jgi:acetoin utilization deacetylase AcuC-like enzyme